MSKYVCVGQGSDYNLKLECFSLTPGIIAAAECCIDTGKPPLAQVQETWKCHTQSSKIVEPLPFGSKQFASVQSMRGEGSRSTTSMWKKLDNAVSWRSLHSPICAANTMVESACESKRLQSRACQMSRWSEPLSAQICRR